MARNSVLEVYKKNQILDEEKMKITEKQIQAVTQLPGPRRYEHFVKVVADWEEAWGLWDDGWALAGTKDGSPVFPLWPAKEYAQLCATGDWENYQPESIALEVLMNELLPKLRNDGVLPGIFYTQENKGVTPSVEQLLEDLEAECEKY